MTRPPFDARQEPSFSPKKRGPRAGKKKSHSRTERFWSSLARGGRWLVTALIWGLLIGGFGIGILWYDLPRLDHLQPGGRAPSMIIQTVDGRILGHYGDQHAQIHSLQDVHPTFIHALTAIEDRRFYVHKGIDPVGIIRALWRNMRAGSVVQGGSTLTQQLAKNLFLSGERSLKRKLQEVLLTLWLEWTFTKDQILVIYLNRVYWGSGAYGIGAAAQRYFHKSPQALSLFECALLAGLLKAPTAYNPLAFPEKAYARAEIVLQAMVETGAITPWQSTEALIERLSPPTEEPVQGVRYFTDWVRSEVHRQCPDAHHQDTLVITTLDPDLQKKADQVIAHHLKDAPYDGLEVALVSMSSDGAIRAMIGGRSWEKSQFNRVTQAHRQPGSLFKIFVYLAALQNGRTPEDLISDDPIRIGTWTPKNFHWQSQRMISLKTAFARSVNTSAVRLAQQIGVRPIQQWAHTMGIQSPIASDLSIALGTSEVYLLEMTGAILPIMSEGYAHTPYGILEVRAQHDQRILYEHIHSQSPPVLTPDVVLSMRTLMQEVIETGTGKAARRDDLSLYGKTGTTQDKKDAWFVGFTPHLLTGVWVGVDTQDVSKKNRPTGSQLPTQLFKELMASLR